MTEQEIKKDIQQAITAFGDNDTVTASEKLLNTLGYKSTKKANVNLNSLKKRAADRNLSHVSYALWDEWKNAHLIFQYSDDEVKRQNSLFEVGYNDTIQSYLFFAVELNREAYTRSQISNITRFINRLYEIPVMIFFSYNSLLTVSVIDRRLSKKDTGKDVLEKVTQIKDINIKSANRAHIEILFDLSFYNLKIKYDFTNFEQLHNAWHKTLDIKLLNKKFFEELSNWYFWAQDYVEFPNDIKLEEDKNVQINLIRLITRLIFVWFLKEKKLVNDYLFDEKEIRKVLKSFDSEGDKSKTYYTAILQNLFFATLNQSMSKREFADDANDFYKDDHGIKNLYRYVDQFAIDKKEILNLFRDIPFLNGGLFDCLDKENEDTGKVEYIDGFSRNPRKVATVPDLLFFGKERIIDLSEGYGYKRNKEKCRGLIEIFKDYKFTIEENTPIEEEVALDPELLGKVFENLLAYYNPETETTARKQTGSFYTPREIVNYMVDESLIAYLKTQMMEEEPGWLQLGNLQSEIFGNEIRRGQLKIEKQLNKSRWQEKESLLEENLRKLIAYSNDEHPFADEEDIQHLIYAIDHCKILDPACGSGAFPMGILHKLVYVLGKLDIDNKRWRELQKRKAQNDISNALNDVDKKERENKLIDINDSFEDNASDYGRKLYLIENCIYGVDIQPIAVQISKLRFFISLIVDQKEKLTSNRGIRPLPNLETKFVAANTLIGLEKPAQLPIGYDQIYPMQEELQKVRHKHFETKSRRDKLKYQHEDKRIRRQIAETLKSLGFGNKDAEKIAAFDLYDQNLSSSWFEPEWMFGFTSGFNILIGNPPYFIVKSSNTPKEILDKYLKYYSADFKVNLFALFLERAIILSAKKGSNSFIIPDSSLNLPAFKKLREYILKNTGLKYISHFNEAVFENAEVGKSVILQYNKSEKYKNYNFRTFLNSENFLESTVELDKILKDTELKFVYKSNESNTDELLDKLKSIKTKLSFYCDIFDGINPGSEEIKNLVITKKKIDKDSKKIIDGKCFNKFTPIKWDGDYIYYNEEFVEKLRRKIEARGESFTARIIKKSNFFNFPKIVTRQTSDTIIATLDLENYYVKNSVHSTLLKPQFSRVYNLDTIICILNSKIIEWYYKTESLESGRLFPQVKIERLRNLPIIYPNNSNFKTLSAYLFALHCGMANSSFIPFFERVLDAMVYELYLPEVIRTANCEVLKHLNILPELKDGEVEKNLKIIEKVYKELSHPTNPISSAMLRLLNVEEIKIIEGRK